MMGNPYTPTPTVTPTPTITPTPTPTVTVTPTPTPTPTSSTPPPAPTPTPTTEVAANVPPPAAGGLAMTGTDPGGWFLAGALVVVGFAALMAARRARGG